MIYKNHQFELPDAASGSTTRPSRRQQRPPRAIASALYALVKALDVPLDDIVGNVAAHSQEVVACRSLPIINWTQPIAVWACIMLASQARSASL